MDYIDIGKYYDIANSKFYSNRMKENLKEALRSEPLTQSFNTFKAILGDNSYLVKEETLKEAKIVFNTKERKRLLETKNLIKNIIKEKNSFDNNYSDGKKIIDDIIDRYQNGERIEGLLEELDCICKKIMDDYNEQHKESNYSNKCSKNTCASVSSIRRKIALWKEKIDGTFNEKTKTITLYMLNICDSSKPNVCLISTFAHELFHAFHFYASENCFFTNWIDRNTDKFVKEGLARYAELAFLRDIEKEYEKKYEKKYSDAAEYAKSLEDSLNDYDIRTNPYAAYKLYKQNSDDPKYKTFIDIFNTSLVDIGDAYNSLINIYYLTYDGNKYINNIKNKAEDFNKF